MINHLRSLVFVVLVAGMGCSDMPIVEPPLKDPVARLFYGTFDQVWRNIQLAMRKYPVRVNNIDGGVLETDYVKGDKLFAQPTEPTPKPGFRYKITVRAVKGQVQGIPVIKVTMLKSAEMQANFFEGFQPGLSNGLEELAILYRIGRYMEIDQALGKLAIQSKKPNSN